MGSIPQIADERVALAGVLCECEPEQIKRVAAFVAGLAGADCPADLVNCDAVESVMSVARELPPAELHRVYVFASAVQMKDDVFGDCPPVEDEQRRASLVRAVRCLLRTPTPCVEAYLPVLERHAGGISSPAGDM